MKLLKKIGKIAGITLGSIISFAIVVILILSCCRNVMYKDFYQNATEVIKQPGLDTKYVQQGLAYHKEDDTFLFSGYMSDKSNSRIYVVNEEREVGHVLLIKENGKKFTGHVGGISVHNDFVYISNSSKVYVMSYSELIENAYKDEVQSMSMKSFDVNNDGSFAFANEDGLWVGEFHYSDLYTTDESHHGETVGGDYHAAWLSHYEYATGENDDPEAAKFGLKSFIPKKIITIRDKVQGFTISTSGKMIASCSWNIYHSYLYVYSPLDLEKVDKTVTINEKEVPVYDLDSRYEEKVLRMPPMSEGLAYNDGNVYISFESASAKYRIANMYPVTHLMAYPVN